MQINSFLKRKSKAQHVVELALLMPIFIILFSYAFQFMVSTYSKYRFSYLFASSIRNTVETNNVFDSMSDEGYQNYDFGRIAKNNALVALRGTPYADPEETDIFVLNADNYTFLVGRFRLTARVLFFGEAGKEYFYYIIPINATFTKPLVLNKTTKQVDDYFYWYYKVYTTKYIDSVQEEIVTEIGDDDEGQDEEQGEENTDEQEDEPLIEDETEPDEGASGGETSTDHDPIPASDVHADGITPTDAPPMESVEAI